MKFNSSLNSLYVINCVQYLLVVVLIKTVKIIIFKPMKTERKKSFNFHITVYHLTKKNLKCSKAKHQKIDVSEWFLVAMISSACLAIIDNLYGN